MISRSTIKLERKNTNIRDFIEIDGYYQSIDSSEHNSGMMFFEDGTFVALLWFKQGVTESMKRENLSQTVRSWKQKGKVRWGIRWGAFKIEKDTLVGQYFQIGTFFGGGWWECDEIKYEIIDRHTFKIVYSKSLFKDDDDRYTNKHPYEVSQKNFIYKFVSADSLPPSDCWLKEEKWIWRHEADWKDYMQRVKQIKEKKK
jgi:hypothetical protein